MACINDCREIVPKRQFTYRKCPMNARAPDHHLTGIRFASPFNCPNASVNPVSIRRSVLEIGARKRTRVGRIWTFSPVSSAHFPMLSLWGNWPFSSACHVPPVHPPDAKLDSARARDVINTPCKFQPPRPHRPAWARRQSTPLHLCKHTHRHTEFHFTNSIVDKWSRLLRYAKIYIIWNKKYFYARFSWSKATLKKSFLSGVIAYIYEGKIINCFLCMVLCLWDLLEVTAATTPTPR